MAREQTEARQPTARWLYTYHQREAAWGYLLVLPALLVVVGIIGFPFLFAIWISFTDRMVGTAGTFVGLTNFEYILRWPSFGRAVANTAILVVATTSIKFVLGLALATLLNQPLRGRAFFRGLMLVPWVLPTFIAFTIWRMLYAPLGGAINLVLVNLGLIEMPVDWLGTTATAMPAIIIAAVWRGLPFFTVSFLAGMQSVPQELYEAASIDGAAAWQRFWHITLPGIRHIVLVVILLATIWASNTFSVVYVLTRGGPSDATTVFTMLAYQQGILNYRLGEASAVSVAFLPVLVTLIVIIAGFLQRDEEAR